jgi:hypothetical protein
VSGAAFEGLAEAQYLQREYPASAAGYERAYSAYAGRGRSWPRAARRARPPGSPATCWATGRSAAAGWPEHGWGADHQGLLGAGRSAARVLPAGGDRDRAPVPRPNIEFLGLAYLGGLFVLTDRVEEGLVLSDEALAPWAPAS